MGKTSDQTVVQKTIIDTLHKEGKTQKVVAERAGCSQSIEAYIHGNFTGREKCGKKRCTSNRDDPKFEKIVKQSRFKNLGELHNVWTEAGVSASRAEEPPCMRRRLREKAYNCRIPIVSSHS